MTPSEYWQRTRCTACSTKCPQNKQDFFLCVSRRLSELTTELTHA